MDVSNTVDNSLHAFIENKFKDANKVEVTTKTITYIKIYVHSRKDRKTIYSIQLEIMDKFPELTFNFSCYIG